MVKNTVEAMHDKLKFGEGARKYGSLIRKTQEYLTRATQRYYGKTPMQIINDIRINFAKTAGNYQLFGDGYCI